MNFLRRWPYNAVWTVPLVWASTAAYVLQEAVDIALDIVDPVEPPNPVNQCDPKNPEDAEPGEWHDSTSTTGASVRYYSTR